MTRFLFDTAVFVYARGAEHPYREPCRQIIELTGRGILRGEASVELVGEFAHILRRRGLAPKSVAELSRQVAAMCRLHALEPEDLSTALTMLVGHPRLGVRDALHVATALRRGIGLIVSSDRDLDGIPGVERVDPVDAVARLAP
ncbi:type II toxin-antitoxin system VapC family toxin [Pseudonocardia eucalypti]|uniref:Ribonuclease VapC n=1 Tax=Pseudonocardia eucalypti TaxID=648755 RepID=A0ABP9R9Y0_9PSEU|nr:putative nucleic acid-binding protein [Pseudonocardia eucalypti]